VDHQKKIGKKTTYQLGLDEIKVFTAKLIEGTRDESLLRDTMNPTWLHQRLGTGVILEFQAYFSLVVVVYWQL
jgi:hypothetical protein